MLASPKRSALLSGVLHCGAILLILSITSVRPQLPKAIHDILIAPIDLEPFHPAHSVSAGGGGGGRHADTPASRGELPRRSLRQFVNPTVEIVNRNPVLPMDMTIIGAPEIRPASFNIGDPNGIIGKLSAGPGSRFGIGDGDGTGVGPGKGPGNGPGNGGGEGGADYLGGGTGGLTPPAVLSKTDPEYSEEARKVHLQGTVILKIEVNTQGLADHFSIQRSLGLGLDEEAVAAVKKWRFRPARRNGKPTAVVAFVEVNFRLL